MTNEYFTFVLIIYLLLYFRSADSFDTFSQLKEYIIIIRNIKRNGIKLENFRETRLIIFNEKYRWSFQSFVYCIFFFILKWNLYGNKIKNVCVCVCEPTSCKVKSKHLTNENAVYTQQWAQAVYFIYLWWEMRLATKAACRFQTTCEQEKCICLQNL